jgi:hypothetical protein
VQALAAPGGVPLWVSDVLPGSTHDLTAARELVLPEARPYLKDLPILADSGYEGAGAGVHVLVKKPARSELDIDTRTRNALLRSLRYCLTNDVNKACWGRWKIAVRLAIRDTDHSRKAFYILRTIALVSAISVPSLVGLDLSGTGGSVVRWLAFALSLITAILTGIVTLYRLGDRWLMYRTHRDDLIAIGWALVKGRGPNVEEDQQAWTDFIAATGKSVAQYNKTYATAVIQAAQSNPESGKSGSHNREEPTTH